MKAQLTFRFVMCLWWAVGTSVSSIAQIPLFNIQTDITVMHDGQTLPNPWAGGLNASQFNTLDLNGDGNSDLVLFDRTSNKVTTFLNQENTYVYAPSFEALFPEITFWLLLRDYNGDGKKDLFTAASNGMRVYKNITENPDSLKWELFQDPIETLGLSGFQVNLKIDVTDIPSLTDVDEDGDLDVLNFVPSVGGTVEFHQNFSIERYGIPDSLEFEKITNRWGGFEECGTCNTYLFTESAACRTAKVEHAGSALLALDLDGDNDKELLLGEISCTNLVKFNNNGTLDTAIFDQVTLAYPPANPIDIQIFPAPFYEDVDFDGIPDLLASPNLFFNEGDLVDFAQSNWYYKNMGTENVPDFQFQQKDFIQEGMIDLGEFTVPAVADVDGDGDQDVLVSNRGKLYGSGDFYATIAFYENTGTDEVPILELREDDYLGFSSQNIIELKIDFEDLDGDGALDLYYTFREKNSGDAQLQYLLNQTAQGLDFTNASLNSVNLALRPRDEAHFVDIDADGDLDLLIGKFQSGLLEWYQNDGSMNFTLLDNNLGDLVGGVRKNELSVETADFTGDGQLDLMLGNWSGKLQFIPDFQNKLSQTFEPITDFIYEEALEGYGSHQWGSGVFPTSFGKDLLLGTAGGGLIFLKNTGILNARAVDEIPEKPLHVFPNPATDQLHLEGSETASIQIYRLTGELVFSGEISAPTFRILVPVDNWSAGVYIVRTQTKNRVFSNKIIIQQ